jgi:hypothetical protein
MQLYAKDFAQRNGYPLGTIKRLCRTGQLPYMPVGRKYLMDEDECKTKLQLLKTHFPEHPVQPEHNAPQFSSSIRPHRQCNKKVLTYSNYTDELTKLIRK